MPATVSHQLSATTPDNPNYEIQPQHWNSTHAITFAVSASEISGLFSNANGVSFGLSNSSITASHNALTTAAQSDHSHGASAANGSFGFQTVSFSNANGISFGTSAGPAITASHNALTSQSNQNITAGNGGFAFQTLSFSNANGISFGTSAGSAITGSHNALTTAMASDAATISNIKVSAGTLSANRSDVTFANSNGVTFGLETNGVVTASVNAGGAGNTVSEWCPYPEMALLSASALGQNSIYFSPIDVPENLNAYRANFFLSVSTQISASNNTKSGGYTISMCLYSRGTGASTERLMSLLSRSAYISFTASSHTRIQVGHPAGIANSTSVSQITTSGAATNTSTYVVSSVGGYRVLSFPISSTLTPGRYWMAVANSSVSANAQGLINCSVLQQTHASNVAYMPFGTVSKASNASWPQVFAGRGLYSVTSGAFPATVALSTDHIRQTAVTVVLPFFNVSGYTTATNQL